MPGGVAAIAPHDSQERFEGLGVTVLKGDGVGGFTANSAAGDGGLARASRTFGGRASIDIFSKASNSSIAPRA